MLASQLMTTPVVTIGPSASLDEAIRLLDRYRITALPVVDGDGHLVGIVCAADVLPRRVIDDPPAHNRENWPDLSAHSVADVMTVFVVSVDKSADATGVARLMLETGVKSVPVLDDGRVVGMLTRRDLLGALVTTDDHIANEVNVLLSQAGLDFQASVNHGEVDLVGWGSDRASRIAAIVAGAVTLAPALLAAATAFMNTSVAKDRGLPGHGDASTDTRVGRSPPKTDRVDSLSLRVTR